MAQEKTSKMLLGLICAGVAVTSASFIAFMLLRVDGQELDTTGYNTLADRHRARVDTRPAMTPLGPSVEGSSAPHYKRAYEGAVALSSQARDLEDQLKDAAWSLMDPADPAVEDTEEAPATLPATCEALGMTAGDSLSAHMNEDACAWFGERRPMAELLLKGANHRGARSPINIWDPWQVESPGQSRRLIPFLTLAQIALIDAHLAGRRDGLDEEVRRLLLLSRACQDLGRGSATLGATVSAMCGRNTMRRLRRLLRQDSLSPELLKLVIQELTLQSEMRIIPKEVNEAEVLLIAPMLIKDRSAVKIPPTAHRATIFGSTNTFQRIVANHAASELLSFWRQYLDIQALTPLKARVERYTPLMEDINKSINPISSMAINAIDAYEARLITHHSSRAALIWGAAVRLAQRQPSSFKLDADVLARQTGVELPLDPLTDTPLSMKATGAPVGGAASGDIEIRSTAMDDPSLKALLEPEIEDGWLTLTLPAPAPLPTP